MKNWLAFVFGPLLAIDTMPRAECCTRRGSDRTQSRARAVTAAACRLAASTAPLRAFSVSRISSGNLPPQMLAPPLPDPATRAPWRS
jgi:hypothetical protein